MSYKNFIIGIISWGKDKDRIERATKLFEQLKDFPKLIIAQGYKPEKTHANDIIIYEPEALGICGARQRLQEEFLKLNIDYIIFMDDDNVVEKININAPFTDYNNQLGNGMFNLQTSKVALLKINFDFSKTRVPHEDLLFNRKLKENFERVTVPLFTVKHSSENSTWRTE